MKVLRALSEIIIIVRVTVSRQEMPLWYVIMVTILKAFKKYMILDFLPLKALL